MLVDRWIMEVLEILLAIFSVYLFFLYFGIFFQRKEGKIRALIGVAAIIAWQFDIWDIFWLLPSAWNLCVAMGGNDICSSKHIRGKDLDEMLFCNCICSHLDADRDISWRSVHDL